MAHLIIEYSANLEARLALKELVECVHAAAVATGVFPLGGLRTRAARRERYRIADGDPDNGFVFLTIRYGQGRDMDTLEQAGQQIFDALCAQLDDLYRAAPLSIGMEMREIDPRLSFKKNNIHERLALRQPS